MFLLWSDLGASVRALHSCVPCVQQALQDGRQSHVIVHTLCPWMSIQNHIRYKIQHGIFNELRHTFKVHHAPELVVLTLNGAFKYVIRELLLLWKQHGTPASITLSEETVPKFSVYQVTWCVILHGCWQVHGIDQRPSFGWCNIKLDSKI